MGFSESEVIALLKKIFATSDPRVIVGIGDDAALVRGNPQQVITTDMAVQGVHFRLDWSSAFDIGRKIAAANIADVISMGGRCDYLVVALSLTGSEEISWIEDLAKGVKYEADHAGAHVVGGDLARSSVITIAVTAIGECKNPILRSGAKVGESIYLSSLTGWSAAGYYLLSKQSKFQSSALSNGALASSSAASLAIKEFQAPSLDYDIDFTAASSMCDISDSLITQGEQMAQASGAQFHFETDRIKEAAEFDELSRLARSVGADVWSWIIGGGEDHVFLATGHNLPGVEIGTVKAGSGISGIDKKMAPDTWSHFKKS